MAYYSVQSVIGCVNISGPPCASCQVLATVLDVVCFISIVLVSL